MCEFGEAHRKTASVNYFSSNPESMIARGVIGRFPYAFRPNCCPRCGKTLQSWEQRPQGRATRCMCIHDYNALVPNNVGSYECLVCGGSLPDHKVRAQHANPREISNHIHDDECMHLWALVHNVSIGEPDVVEMFRHPFTNSHAYIDRPDKPRFWAQQPLPPPPRLHRFLPPPQTQVRYEPRENVSPDQAPVKRVYKGKKVKQMLLNPFAR